ncbi:MAG: hypothetical protein A2W80_17900 [Candidatus Riflebacteria bacterium GWC2_50_8]|nr:MAG: hypothetical protein A2W80_17900 [Candidatus Riflebacteria bacterium GWC2_50_8]
MFLTERKNFLPVSVLTAMLLLLALLSGCGLRQSQTGSLSSRVIDADGNAVVNAVVFSIFAEQEKVYSGVDGGFYLSELPAGLNNIVVMHNDFALEERQIEIKSGDATVIESIRLDRANAPHRIFNVQVADVASTSARITWNTYRSVICNVEYGTTMSYGTIYREERPAEQHAVILTDLQPETVYHFRVQYIDDGAISHYSYDFPFQTEDSDRPDTPSAIRLRPLVALGVVEVEWDAASSSSSVQGYNIYRKVNDDEWQRINDSAAGLRERVFADINAESGTFCRYAITAVNSFGAESDKRVSEVVFVPGIINRNVTISVADSPVSIHSDLVIAAGVTFAVEAGSEFLIADTDAFAAGLDEQRVEIQVNGRISLQGTAENPVKFGPLQGSGQRDHWAGIRVLSSMTGVSEINNTQMFGCSGYALKVAADRIQITNLVITHSENGVSLAGLKDTLELQNCSFKEIAGVALKINKCRRVLVYDTEFSQVGMAIENFTDYADDQLMVYNTFIDCLQTGITGTFGKSKIYNVLIVAETGLAVKLEKLLNSRENFIDHCTIDAYNGILVEQGEVTIENNIVINRLQKGSVGINNSSFLAPEYDFNNVYGFNTAYQGCSAGVGAVQTDPKFVGGNPFDYNLAPDSTLRLQDYYGSEMGRYGSSRL